MANKELRGISEADRPWLEKLGYGTVKGALSSKGRRIVALSHSSDTSQADASRYGGPESLFLKRYIYRGPASIIRQLFRGTLFGKSRAHFEYDMLLAMRKRGIPAPRPVAYGDKRKAGLLFACCLITEGEQDMQSLDTYVLGRLSDSEFSSGQAKCLIQQVATTIRKMHQAGVIHGALFYRNILVRQTDTNRWEFAFLDPARDAKALTGPVPEDKLAADLSKLFADALAIANSGTYPDTALLPARPANLIRFGKAYFGKERLEESDKAILRNAVRLAEPLLAQEAKRLAVGDTIKQIQEHVEATEDPGGRDHFNSIEAFLQMLLQRKVPRQFPGGKKQVVRFTFYNVDGSAGTIRTALRVGNGRIVTDEESIDNPDLAIETDSEIFLAVVNGQADAFALVRSGRLEIDGNTAMLAELAKLIGLQESWQ